MDKRFWLDTTERAVKTAAQTAAAFLVGMAALSEVDWGQLGGVVGLATLLSILTSLSSFGFGAPGTASVTASVAPMSNDLIVTSPQRRLRPVPAPPPPDPAPPVQQAAPPPVRVDPTPTTATSSAYPPPPNYRQPS